MILTEKFLLLRHKYWMERIGEAGIWDAEKFKPVMFIVRKRSKSYDGLFCRKWVKKGEREELQDSIIMYQQYPDLSQQEIDDTLVHEMIHQYIYQNNIIDSSTHGKVFLNFMRRINDSFPNELNLRVSGGIKEWSGEGDTLHKLIIVHHDSGLCHCCKVNPNKSDVFMRLIGEHKNDWKVRSYELCESKDRYFDSFTACTHRLHGVRMTEKELAVFRRKCGVRTPTTTTI